MNIAAIAIALCAVVGHHGLLLEQHYFYSPLHFNLQCRHKFLPSPLLSFIPTIDPVVLLIHGTADGKPPIYSLSSVFNALSID